MTIGLIIQARTGSTRLPQKMTLPFFNNVGILENILIRLNEVNFDVPIIVATTNNESDDIIEKIACSQNVQSFRGSEENVLNRFINAAEKYSYNKIIRLCADNPFLDINALQYQINSFKNTEVDYWCYSLSNKTPTIKTHYGFWTEGVTLKALKNVANYSNELVYQEHVTNYIYTHPELFKIHFEKISQLIENESSIRLTIDTMIDFQVCKMIYSQLKNNKIPIEANYVVKYVISNPNWINKMKKEIMLNSK